MSVVVDRPTVSCDVCGAHVNELRRGRCWGCYSRWAELRPVGRGAVCAVCSERRRDHLRLTELHGRSLPLCHGCAARSVKLPVVPESVDELREALTRDRRQQSRRGEGHDHRIFPRERRVDDRRADPDIARPPSPAPPAFQDLVIELGDSDIDEIDATVVRDLRAAGGE